MTQWLSARPVCHLVAYHFERRKLRTIAIDDPGVCQSVSTVVCLSVQKRLNESTFCLGRRLHGDPRNIILDGDPHSLRRGGGGSMQPLPNYFGHLFDSR